MMAQNGPRGYRLLEEDVYLQISEIYVDEIEKIKQITRHSYSEGYNIAVEKLEDGKYTVVDGCHRLAALFREDPDLTEIRVDLFESE